MTPRAHFVKPRLDDTNKEPIEQGETEIAGLQGAATMPVGHGLHITFTH
jgi:hypothetical protein